MAEPTKHRRYTKRQKLTAVLAAEMTTVRGAAEGAGVPESTLRYWMDDPKFAQYRAKTRADLAQEMGTLAHLFAMKLSQRVDELEPRDLVIALGVVTDKAQLLSGAPTSRTETRALSDGLNDHEKQQLRDALDRLLGDPASEDEGSAPIRVGPEVRE